jgi:choline monooxygenase
MPDSLYIDPDITKAHTLPAEVYTDPNLQGLLREKLFLPSWQWLGGQEWLNAGFSYQPFYFIPGYIDEPLLFVNQQGKPHCLSNVCTHRAKILIEEACTKPFITCGYHGRCFHSDGRFRSMPEFREVQNFPTEGDNLKSFPLVAWREFFFAALGPVTDLSDVMAPVEKHMKSYPFSLLKREKKLDKTYHVKAHWLTYCDNYLEGFHIPFVHPALNQAIRYEDYEVRVFDHANVQVARCKPGQKAIPLQPGDTDYGQDIYAYYWFVYPNLMLNFYHWGISVNQVIPQKNGKTEIRFLTYKRSDADDADFSDTALDLTEMEDEAVVESVQKGLESLTYRKGRFSAVREQGVHAFHRYIFEKVFAGL